MNNFRRLGATFENATEDQLMPSEPMNAKRLDQIKARAALTPDQIVDCRTMLTALTVDQSNSGSTIKMKQPEWSNRVGALCDMATDILALCAEVERLTAIEADNERLREALQEVHDDLILRANPKGVVSVGVSCWLQICRALEAKP